MMAPYFPLLATLCFTSGAIFAALFGYFVLWWGVAIDDAQVDLFFVLGAFAIGMLTQVGLVLVPRALRRPRPTAYVVVLFCAAWLLYCAYCLLSLISSGRAESWWPLLPFCGMCANAAALWVSGNVLFATRSKEDDSSP